MMRVPWPGVGLGLSFGVGAAAAVSGRPWAFVVALGLAMASEYGLRRADPRPRAERATGALAVRTVGRDLLLVALVSTCDHIGGSARAEVPAGLLVLAGLQLLATIGHDARRRELPTVDWRHLDVAGVRAARDPVPAWAADPSWLGAWMRLPLYLGAVLAGLGWSGVVVTLGLVVSVAGLGGLVGADLLAVLRARAGTPAAQRVVRLAAALAASSAQVVLYVSEPDDPRAATYLAMPWLAALAQLSPPAFVLVREREHLAALAGHGIPVVLVVRSADLEKVLPPSLGVALYPGHTAKNNHLIRLPGIRDVFIGNGDSDKPDSASPLALVFDEVWVSGPAGRERYERAAIGIGAKQIREIGRPGWDGVRRAAGAGRPRVLSVLYAPTVEGFDDEAGYSSVVAMGEPILRALQARPGVRVIFRPHPASGRHDRAVRAEVDRLARLVQRWRGPHRVSRGDDVAGDLAEADVLVTDICALITDFAMTGRPYVVTDPNGWGPEELRGRCPTVRGAYLIGRDVANLGEVLDTIAHGDPMAAGRAERVPRLLGEGASEPLLGAAIADAIRNRPTG